MDALTDILETIHLRGSLYCRSELGAPWGMAIAAGSDAQFHVVRRGRCWLRLTTEPDTAPILLEAGDMVVLPRGHAHQVSDHPDTPVLPLEEFLRCQAPPANQPPPRAPSCATGETASRPPWSAATSASTRAARTLCSRCCRRCC